MTSFIGREREIVEIKDLLGSIRLLTLIGPGGCGKTRLAAQAAADVLTTFPDGVWFVDLVGLSDPALVPQAVGAVLGVREAPGRPFQAMLVEHLQARHVLLVLDNCEHLVGACASLADILLRSCPHLRILATSREALGIDGERIVRVPSLSVPDLRHLPPLEQLIGYEAVRLLTDRAQWSLPAFRVTPQNARAVAQVCVQLDGIPLAIEMAAARVKVLTVEQIAARLDDRFRLLRAGSRTALPRHQTLRAAIDWSYDLLTEKEQAVLRRASVFAGGWTIEAAEAVCAGGGIEASDVLDVLTRLVERSLVITEPQGGAARYRLLETMRQYGRDRLRESGETDRICRRHRDWYLEFAERAEPNLRSAEQDLWLSRIEAEHDNLRAALAWSLGEARGPQGEAGTNAGPMLRLAGALWWFWFIGGYFSEGRRWLEQVLAAAGEGAPPVLSARALLGKGLLTLILSDFKGARALFDESLLLLRATEDHVGTAWATGWRGVSSGYAGDSEGAVTRFQESLALFERLADAWGIAWMTSSLGMLLFVHGDAARGVPLVKASVGLSRAVGDKWVISVALHNAANVAIAMGDIAGATPLAEESVAVSRGLRDRRAVARALSNLGQTAYARGAYDEAAAALHESLVLFRQADDKRGLALCFERIGSMACGQGRWEQAARLFGASDALREAIGVVEAGPGRAIYEFGAAGDRAALRIRMGEAASEAACGKGRAMTPDEAIEYALASVEAAAPAPGGTTTALLTPREHEVAALIARGLTNRQIGASLVIAERTVDTHVEHILNKLGFNSRTQIAAWAVEQGLHKPTPG